MAVHPVRFLRDPEAGQLQPHPPIRMHNLLRHYIQARSASLFYRLRRHPTECSGRLLKAAQDGVKNAR